MTNVVSAETTTPGNEYSPFVNQNFPNTVYWGDTHVHTNVSLDSGLFGNKLGPRDAYRFARGEQVTASGGFKTKLVRPLDFLVVADHAEYAGIAPGLETGDPILLATPTGKRWYQMWQEGGKVAFSAFREAVMSVTENEDLIKSDEVMRSYWENNNAISEEFNEPGKFTALIGYEWGSMPGGNNIHRVVIFRDGAEKANQILPTTSFVSEDPESLWAHMAGYEQMTQGKVLAIPHNGNISNGQMFSVLRANGKPIDKAYAQTRSRWEPLYEVTQMKGDAEAHPFLSPDDQFADFETWDKANLNGTVKKENHMLQGEYARSALKIGMQQEQALGVNPFKFGMIGSTDTHTSLATTREDNFFSKSAHFEPNEKRSSAVFLPARLDDPKLAIMGGDMSASGLTAVWSRENTREALWDSMSRKEVYATTGSRITVRVFAGWDFKKQDVESAQFAEIGYEGGVPMGGDLTTAPKGIP